MWDDENYHDDSIHAPILRADIEWAYGIMLMVRELDLPKPVKAQVDTFLDHYHRIYEH